MLGGLNSVKRENHHYKYAHCTNINDVKHINLNFKEDYANNDKNWDWNLDNYVHDGSQNFLSGSTMVSFNSEMPKTTNAKYFFYNCKSLKEANTNYKDFTNVMGIFIGCIMSEWPKDFSPNTTNFKYVFSNGAVGYTAGSSSQPVTIPYNESINKATDLTSAFESSYVGQTTWFRQMRLDTLYDFSNLENGEGALANGWTYTETGLGQYLKLNLINLTNGNRMFSGCEPLYELDSPLPKLKTATNMFSHCQLSKNGLRLLKENLPTWEDGGSHSLGTIGVYIGYKYDPEATQYLEDIKSKGWTITDIYYHNSNNDNGVGPIEWPLDETLPHETISNLNLDDIQLPFGYMRCEYLEDTGSQYINLNYVPTINTGTYIIEKQISKTISGGYPLGLRDTNNHSFVSPRWCNIINATNFMWNTSYSTTSIARRGFGASGIVSLNFLNDKKAIIKWGETSWSNDLSTLSFNFSLPLYLFAINDRGNTNPVNYWYGRIYRVKISEGDQIIRDFIPALDPDGKPCMYEMIEGKPYYNAATSGDDFLYKVYEDYEMPEIDLTTLNIVEGSDYIPDASGWNEIATAKLTEAEEKIVRVVNGVAYNE